MDPTRNNILNVEVDDDWVVLNDGTLIALQELYEIAERERFADVVSFDEFGGVCE